MLLTMHGQDETIKNRRKKSTKSPWLEALAVLGCSKHYVYILGGNGAILPKSFDRVAHVVATGSCSPR
jgi:hypothetical protein